MQFKEHDEYMKTALMYAHEAANAGEIPVGCVIVCEGRIIASGVNRVKESGLQHRHAELEALEQAATVLKSRGFENCTLYTTLEPCGMCSGAIAHYRVGQVVFGAYDTQYGCMFSKMDLCKIMGHKTVCIGGVLEEECSTLLKKFFDSMRKSTGK